MHVRMNSPLMAIAEVNRLKYIRAVNWSRRGIVYHQQWTTSFFPADFTTDSVKLYTNTGGNLTISLFIRVSILLIRNLSLSIYGVLICIIQRATAHEKRGSYN